MSFEQKMRVWIVGLMTVLVLYGIVQDLQGDNTLLVEVVRGFFLTAGTLLNSGEQLK